MLNEKDIIKYFSIVNSHAKKELGQNFLISENVVNDIVALLDLNENDFLLEIGPGLGAMSEKLINQTSRYVAVEYDKKFVDYLSKAFEDSNIEIVNQNILKYKDFSFNKIVGNLPYYISTDILSFIIKNFDKLESATFMVQKEFFDRITSKNKREKTPINFELDYLFEVKKEFIVKKNCFFPAPTVDSIVFSIKQKKEKDRGFAGFLFKIIEISFQNRRKNISNNLKKIIPDADLRTAVFANCNISESERPEDLTLDNFEKIATEILKQKKLKL
ncbi:MAG: 16S rRNA (adenine(1518)-N(6)/adenine(1519)-N(6))-dimethyltransferase RsmA [Candidatus Onthovivens sp.]|nr:16S rRNA (adenine(1518)-N(6)/adenine(1519)-N(6))-dimethyltransferase RsmA [Candidatus Onthovivens sp.]